MPLVEKRFYEFGPFRLDARQKLLQRDGELIPLAPKTFDTLLALLESAGEVLAKDDLLKNIWPDSFVEEGSLAQNISILRKVLGERTDGQRYIQTIPKRGYRFVTPPDPLAAAKRDESEPSIAILPFANMSGDKEQEYFSDGLAEEIINLLAQIPGLKVTARTSAFAFRGKEQDITKIAEVLHVGTILEGSIRKSGNRVRVTAQLINAADGYRIWCQRYDRALADVFSMQDEIAAAITEALQIKLVGRSAAGRYQPNLRAYDMFLRARYQMAKVTPDGIASAKGFLELAIALDPGYPEPYAELGQYYLVLGLSGSYPADEAMPAARMQAQKALELNEANPRAHTVLCTVAGVYDHDWKEADRQFRLALATDSIPPEIRGRCALNYLLPLGRFQEAILQFERALEQDPLSATCRGFLALTLLSAGLNDRAQAEAEKCLEIHDNYWIALFAMSLILVQRGDLDQARQAAEKGVLAAPWYVSGMGLLAGILARLGEVNRLQELLESLRKTNGGLFWYHFLRSDIGAAADCYAQMIEGRVNTATYYAAASFLKPLRSSPRWPALAKMMNLPVATQ